MIGIYMIVNNVDNKIYIGQSIDIDKRFKSHKQKLNSNTHYNVHLQNAWNKYGENEFEFSIICECEENKLNELEEYYIFCLDATNLEIGYNVALGGNSSKTSDTTKKKLSLLNQGEKHPKSKSIYCVELDKVFPYARKITEELGINHGNIIRCCKGTRNTCHNMHWMYYDDYLEKGIIISSNKKQPKRKHKTPVYCKELDQSFESIAMASRKTGCDSRAIHNCCNNPSHTINNLHWKYLK